VVVIRMNCRSSPSPLWTGGFRSGEASAVMEVSVPHTTGSGAMRKANWTSSCSVGRRAARWVQFPYFSSPSRAVSPSGHAIGALAGVRANVALARWSSSQVSSRLLVLPVQPLCSDGAGRKPCTTRRPATIRPLGLESAVTWDGRVHGRGRPGHGRGCAMARFCCYVMCASDYGDIDLMKINGGWDAIDCAGTTNSGPVRRHGGGRAVGRVRRLWR
jgi:hypothetical protein